MNKEIHSLSILEVDGKKLIIRHKNGMMQVNATEMGKTFGKGKSPDNWLANQSANDYIKALDKMLKFNSLTVPEKSGTAVLVEVIRGGNDKKKQGTWFHEDVALEYARWLSPEFGVMVNWKFKEYVLGLNNQLINSNKTIIQNIKRMNELDFERKELNRKIQNLMARHKEVEKEIKQLIINNYLQLKLELPSGDGDQSNLEAFHQKELAS